MTPQTNDTAQKLLQVTMMLMRSLASSMRAGEDGLSPAHVGIMARLDGAPCSLTELARTQWVRLPTMSRSVSLLVDKGLAERQIPEGNRRQTMVSLTPEGKRVLERIKRRNERHVAEVLEPLDAAERTKVHAGLTILGRMLSPTDAVKKTR
ncbi:MAG: hypothetical protein EPO31_02450 [Gammaproteobacteria bacterium]|nr:MAG: hypothetical protein EPO31_02450 [Gammaproteobacteria bacterium]